MFGILPHSKAIRNQASDYLDEAAFFLVNSLENLREENRFHRIYKVSLACDVVLSKLQSSSLHPRINTLRHVVRRVPLLVSISQISLAVLELRQLIELVFWCIFFTDHPVEWNSFEVNPTKGYMRDSDKPISYLANRETKFYANYARERFLNEPSGLAVNAVNKLEMERTQLNRIVHPSIIAVRKTNLLSVEELSFQAIDTFNKSQKNILSSSCILLSAFRRTAYEKFPPLCRAWFEWLIGNRDIKKLKKTGFGL